MPAITPGMIASDSGITRLITRLRAPRFHHSEYRFRPTSTITSAGFNTREATTSTTGKKTTPKSTTTTHVVGAPKLTFTYSGIGTTRHVYAQLVDDTTGLVLGNLVTPISVTLDGRSHDVTVDLEQVAQTLKFLGHKIIDAQVA